ncbi:unnamed protein product [Ascophyllum nodosum]
MVVVEAAAPETDWITQKTEDGAQNNITQLAGVEPSGVGTSAATVQLVPEEMANNSPLLTPEELRLQRYGKMLERAGFAPAVHLTHLESLQNKKGADAMRLGVVSEKHYHDIWSRRAFDEFFFQIPLTKSALEQMPTIAREILSKDSSVDFEELEERETEVGRAQSTGTCKPRNLQEEEKLRRIGFKQDLFTPPGFAPPPKNIPNSEGRHKFFSGYDGAWENGNMSGFGVYRFTDGFTFEGMMRNNWPFGEGIAHYANGGCYAGRWLDGKYEGHGRLTSPTGTVYEGNWHEGRRSGEGNLKFKSGSTYEGGFLLGVFHGRGRFQSANLNVTYDGCWNSGFISGYGTLTMPDGIKVVRPWPSRNRFSRFDGRLSLRGALELVDQENEEIRLKRLDEDDEIYGVSNYLELQLRVTTTRKKIAESRANAKINARKESAAHRKAAKIAMMEAKIKMLLDTEEIDTEPDDIEKGLLKWLQ